jgi:hypothetical protein
MTYGIKTGAALMSENRKKIMLSTEPKVADSSQDEVIQVIRALKNNKAPGSDTIITAEECWSEAMELPTWSHEYNLGKREDPRELETGTYILHL